MIVLDAENKCVPLKKRTTNTKPLWMNKTAAAAIKHSRVVYNKYKDNSHPACRKATKSAKKAVNESKRSFENKLASKIKDDKKSFYAYMQSKSKFKSNIGSVKGSDGFMIEDRGKIADEFNNFFASVFTDEDTLNVPEPQAFPFERPIEDVLVNEEDVARRLGLLKEGKAPGPDKLSPRMMKLIHDELTYPVTLICQKSISESMVPKDWKLGNVSPLFKKGCRSEVSNYRPVSLTSQLCKLMEGIVRDQIVKHLETNNLMRGSQHGFRQGRSCLTNLLSFLEHITECVDHHSSFDVIFLDMAKAFDTVPHLRLLKS